MRVYILVDSEGEAGISREKDEKSVYGPWQAEFIRDQATRDASAAARAAQTAGAKEIVIHDVGYIRGVSPMGLVLHYERLPRGVKIAHGLVAIHEVAANGFDAAMLIGHHAMAGTPDGVMAHTFSSAAIENMWLNGGRIGEIGIEAIVLGAYGIPVIMVSGDEAACREAKTFLGRVALAPVKKGFNAHGAISLHPEDAGELIYQTALKALGKYKDYKPLIKSPPYELRVDCYTQKQAKVRSERKGGILLNLKSYLIKTNEAYRLL